MSNGLRHGVDEQLHRDGFHQVLESAVFERLRGSGYRRRSGDEHDGQARITFPNRCQERDSVHVGHRNVADYDLEALPEERLERLCAAADGIDRIAGPREQPGRGAQQREVILDEQHLAKRCRGALGRSFRRRILRSRGAQRWPSADRLTRKRKSHVEPRVVSKQAAYRARAAR